MSIGRRARGGRASGPASPASRGLSPFGVAGANADVPSGSLVGANRLLSFGLARLRRTAVGAPAFFRSKRCGIRFFLSPKLESERSLGWGRGLSGEKSLLQSEKCIKMINCFLSNFTF